jgi:hypothetical protein
VGADARDGHGFEAQVVHAAIDDGAHGLGDVRHGETTDTNFTNYHEFFWKGGRRKNLTTDPAVAGRTNADGWKGENGPPP